MTKCNACHRKTAEDNKYCLHHKQVFDYMNNHYKVWINAYGRISRKEFLAKLSNMQETGVWVKEIIELELKK
jgi:hypothetical protein